MVAEAVPVGGVAARTTRDWVTSRSWLVPFAAAGIACIVGGGLLSAATAYVTTEKTAWATAYLVLVGGVAQVVLGAATAWLAPRADRRLAWTAFVAWNLGNAGVLAGQLGGVVALTDVGGALLVVALILVLVGTRGRGAPADRSDAAPPAGAGATAADPGRAWHRAWVWVFRALVVLLAISIPTGLVLAHLGG